MTHAAAAVLADALRLDEQARAQVAAELIASLDGPTGTAVESLWAVEIERRVAVIEAGIAPLESWEDVRRRLDRHVLGR